ncbi:MAG: hypothetical protein CO182_11725, partial [Lysobacterales bacterium CG_4_9_14_3_um_filter_62_6]
DWEQLQVAGQIQLIYQIELGSTAQGSALLWARRSQVWSARSIRLDNAAVTGLQASGVSGDLVKVLDDGFLVGRHEVLDFIAFDPSLPAHSIVSESGQSVITHIGHDAALVHRLSGTAETFEWRSLRGDESRVLISAQRSADMVAKNRCFLDHEISEWFDGESLIHDLRTRTVTAFDVNSSLSRIFEIPVTTRVGDYQASLHIDFSEYSEDLELVRSERTVACQSASGAFTLNRRVPAHALVFDGEAILGRHLDNCDCEPEKYIDGAHSAYVLDRASGVLTRFGGYTLWPLLDPLDQ